MPQLLVVALGTVLRAPLAVTALLILPVVEIIETLGRAVGRAPVGAVGRAVGRAVGIP